MEETNNLHITRATVAVAQEVDRQSDTLTHIASVNIIVSRSEIGIRLAQFNLG